MVAVHSKATANENLAAVEESLPVEDENAKNFGQPNAFFDVQLDQYQCLSRERTLEGQAPGQNLRQD